MTAASSTKVYALRGSATDGKAKWRCRCEVSWIEPSPHRVEVRGWLDDFGPQSEPGQRLTISAVDDREQQFRLDNCSVEEVTVHGGETHFVASTKRVSFGDLELLEGEVSEGTGVFSNAFTYSWKRRADQANVANRFHDAIWHNLPTQDEDIGYKGFVIRGGDASETQSGYERGVPYTAKLQSSYLLVSRSANAGELADFLAESSGYALSVIRLLSFLNRKQMPRFWRQKVSWQHDGGIKCLERISPTSGRPRAFGRQAMGRRFGDWFFRSVERMEENSLGLSEALQFYFRSRSDVVLRRRFLVLYLALETIVSNAPTTEKYWVPSRSQQKKVKKGIKEVLKKLELRDDLPDGKINDLMRVPAKSQQHALFADLGVDTSDLDPDDSMPWVNTRNTLVHEASAPETPELLDQIERLEILVERLILRMLQVPPGQLDPDERFENRAATFREPTLFDWD